MFAVREGWVRVGLSTAVVVGREILDSNDFSTFFSSVVFRTG